MVGRDGATAWGWIQIPANDTDLAVVLDRINTRPRTEDAPLLAAGAIGLDAAGFVTSYRQAQRAHHVAVLGGRGRTIERYDDPGLAVVDLCARDPSALQAWVLTVLGPQLAADTTHAERLRTTLRIYLACERSLSAAAAVMTMHKNSIRYRVDNAEKLLPGHCPTTDSPSRLPSPHVSGSGLGSSPESALCVGVTKMKVSLGSANHWDRR